MSSKMILGFVGPIASGKGTAAKYLMEQHGAVGYRFSTPLRDVLKRLYLDDSRKNMQDLSLSLRTTFGDDLLASAIAGDVKKEIQLLVVVDGVRRLPDIKYLKAVAGFHLVAIMADQKTRWQRLTQRGENPDDRTKTLAQFQKDEQAEAEQHIKEVAATAEFTIDNNGSREQLNQQIENILKKVNGD